MADLFDELRFTVEDDGTVTVDTDEVSRPNHLQAEELLAFLAKRLGSNFTIKGKKRQAHTHAHGKLTHSH